jgi:phosphatidylinositol alpha-1,6-mannosyltransferase
MKRHLVIFSEDFPPYSGGIAQWAAGMATALAENGLRITVFARSRSAYPADDRKYPFAIRWVHGNHWRQLRTWYCYRAMRDFLREQSIDAVIATTWNVSRGLVSLSRQFGVPLITVIHGLEVTRNLPRIKIHWLKQTLLASRFVIAVSRFTKEQAVGRYRIPEHHIRVFPNGVNPTVYTPGREVSHLRKKMGIHDEKVILTLARVIERKGHEQVIQALVRIREAVPKVKYVIAGPWDERYYRDLQRLIQKLDLKPAVQFTGYLETDTLADYYNLCDVYVMLSRTLKSTGDTEGFGITYLEANACEKPVIGGRSGGVEDAIVDGETGFLVDPMDTRAISDILIRLLKDPELAGRIGKQGRRRILSAFTWDAIAKSVIPAIYQEH